MTRYSKTRAVVLSSRPLGEADRIVTLFCETRGRVDAVVKGVRRTKSRWGGRLEPFGVVDLILFRGRSLYTITSAQLVAVFARLREDREAISAAALVCEAAAGLFAEEEEQKGHERVFSLLACVLAEFDAGFAGAATTCPLVLGSLLSLLHEAGYMPVLDHCVVCGDRGAAVGFSAARGGLVCTRCLHEGVPMSAEAMGASPRPCARSTPCMRTTRARGCGRCVSPQARLAGRPRPSLFTGASPARNPRLTPRRTFRQVSCVSIVGTTIHERGVGPRVREVNRDARASLREMWCAVLHGTGAAWTS